MMRRPPAPWWVFLCAAGFVGYFALLVYCDLWRPESEGFEFLEGRSGLAVRQVTPGSPAARAGLVAGDEIVRADGHSIDSRVAWEAVDINFRFGRPLRLDVVRGGLARTVLVRMEPASWSRWSTREGIELLVTRLVQMVTLLLGLVVVFRRPFDPAARVGGWLLATCGVFCIVLPYRVADVWRELPLLVGAAMWLPYASTVAIPALLLSFFLSFPRRGLRSPAAWLAIWTPMCLVLVAYLRMLATVVYQPDVERFPPGGFGWRWGVSIGYLVATAVVAAVKYRRADPTERRRLGVLLLGGGVGCVAGGPIVLAYWRGAQTGLFASPAVAVAALFLLVVPLSFAYAILRHRLFNVGFIVRQGVRYALARRLLHSLVPGLLIILAGDVYFHRDRSIGELVGARASVYLVLVGLVVLAQFQRQHWLDALDRRFFRERYDARRTLRRVVEELRQASAFDRAAARAVGQIEVALRPRFATVLAQAPGDETFRMVATSPAGAGPTLLPADARFVTLARVIGKPVDLSQSKTAWLAAQLPADELAAIAHADLELLVPVGPGSRQSDALLALGPRQSEEPYAAEDLDLLASIASSLAALLAREQVRTGEAWTFAECPHCGRCYDSGKTVCADEARELVMIRLPRLLAGRYRLDQRLGQGGMGVVYGAADLSLERNVAVKLLREDLLGDRETAVRFQREATISASFAHPHVVTIYDFGIAGESRAFLVMERLQGRTLREELQSTGPLAASRARSVLQAVCSAVDAAHRRHLVHRDLKPENVFLSCHDGVESPKILDFGIAKVLPSGPRLSECQTRVGLLVGTPQYMAPEQLQGDEAGPSWDLWALGVMAHEMLTGAHPFGSVAFSMAGSVAPTVLPSRGTARQALDPRWQPFFGRALALDPAARPPSAAAFLAEFEQVLAEE